ncbi:MAG: lipase [Oscillibacter sp.]|nr:lipase [Oscillibacter sp.]
MRILCFGDSNTYGFDPRSCLGDRYPAEIRWPERLAALTGWQVRNEGLNGREIPHRPGELARAAALIAGGPWDAAVILLGDNDLLQGCSPEEVSARMERFLEHLGDAPVLLIAPPPMTAGTWVTEARLLPDSRQLAAGYRDLAERLGIRFAAAAGWGIETLFDGVHFSEAGHRVFAEKIRRELEAF